MRETYTDRESERERQTDKQTEVETTKVRGHQRQTETGYDQEGGIGIDVNQEVK